MNNQPRTAVLFPGQGSQFVGMGREFLEVDAGARELMAMAEAVSGFPLGKLCLEGPMEELTRAVHLQPAITITNLICWQMLEKAGVRPRYFAGHSLGEYSALCAAGVLAPEDTMKLVTERGRLMEREGRKHPGGMHAILGLTLAEVSAVIEQVGSVGVVTAANHNSERQVVVSGDFVALDAVAGLVAEQGGKAIPLPVSVANHSPLVADAVPDFEAVMATVEFKKPATPVYFNVTAAMEDDPAVIRRIMARQIASPVRWYETVNALLAASVACFVEVGPKKVLTGLLKKILPKGMALENWQIDSPETLRLFMDSRG